jgi:hypothetical protein
MPFCRRCGSELSRNPEAKFCPSCGISLKVMPITTEPYSNNQAHDVAKDLQRRKKGWFSNRIHILAVVFLVCFIITCIGALYPLSQEDAVIIVEGSSDLVDLVQSLNFQLTASLIFGNNLMLCLIMFTPFLGPVLGAYFLFSTGLYFGAEATILSLNPIFLLGFTFILPFAWLEYISYAIAISSSFWFTLMLVRRKMKNEIGRMVKSIAVCSLLLLAASFIETLMIFALI